MHSCVTSHLWLKTALHASSHPCMYTCVLRCGCFLLACPLFSTSSHRSPSSPSRCSSQSSTRGPGPNPCATSAWGPWPLLTRRHPSQKPYLIKNGILIICNTERTSFLLWFQACQVRLLDLHQLQGHL